MKRILREAIGSGGGIDGMSARAALMEYRSTPQRDLKHSPAELLFGRAVRDLLQLQEGKWLQDPRYLLTAEEREERYAEKLKREGAKWAEHTRTLEPLKPGDDVLVQCHAGAQKGKWTKSGRIVQKVGESSYVVRYDGTGRASKRNRTHLRKMTVAPTPVTEHETSAIRRTNEDGTRASGAQPTQDSDKHSWEETNEEHSPKGQMSQGPDIRQTQHLAVSCKVEDRGATRVKQEPEEDLDDLWAQPIWTNPDIPQWQLATSKKARRQGKRELDNLVSDLSETAPAQAKRKSVKPNRLTVGGLTLAGLSVAVKPGGKEAKRPWVTYPPWAHLRQGAEESPWPMGLPCPPHVGQGRGCETTSRLFNDPSGGIVIWFGAGTVPCTSNAFEKCWTCWASACHNCLALFKHGASWGPNNCDVCATTMVGPIGQRYEPRFEPAQGSSTTSTPSQDSNVSSIYEGNMDSPFFPPSSGGVEWRCRGICRRN